MRQGPSQESTVAQQKEEHSSGQEGVWWKSHFKIINSLTVMRVDDCSENFVHFEGRKGGWARHSRSSFHRASANFAMALYWRNSCNRLSLRASARCNTSQNRMLKKEKYSITSRASSRPQSPIPAALLDRLTKQGSSLANHTTSLKRSSNMKRLITVLFALNCVDLGAAADKSRVSVNLHYEHQHGIDNKRHITTLKKSKYTGATW